MPDTGNTNPDVEACAVRIDVTKPSPARIYDVLLGGKDNFEVDREAAREIEARLPNARSMMRANRDFMGRTVEFLAEECGIRQILDIGSGLPLSPNVHEIAQRFDPDTRVVYVDNDPIVAAHGRALLSNNCTKVITADVRTPASIHGHPELRELIDWAEPVAVLLVAVLHFVTDEEKPVDIVKSFRSQMIPGSYIAISHADYTPQVAAAAQLYDQATSRATPRSREEVRRFFVEGFELIPPGLVQISRWRPEPVGDPADVAWWGGVARLAGAEAGNG